MECHRERCGGRSLRFWSLICRNLLILVEGGEGGAQTSLIAHSGLYANNFRGGMVGYHTGFVWANEPAQESAEQKCC